ncbi:MAG TPA: cytochrome c biogenesis protein CcsA [Candidatus Limnocylindria bacterium]|nr:cytochrome c biogenesis protein CcsA [Candidatus Limnocylindria bacterium]
MTALISVLLVASLAVLVLTAAGGLALVLVGLARVPAPLAADGVPVAVPPRSERQAQALRNGIVAAFGLLAISVLLRALTVGHAPWSNLHEFSVALAATMLGTFLVLSRTQPIAGLAPLAALLAGGVVGFAIGLDDRVDSLVPALQSPLLTVHVGAAIVAYAVAGIAFLAAVAEIGQRASADAIGLLPPAAVARAVGHRAVLIAFPILTIAIVLGSVWANVAWRSYWSNDPKELAAAATWLVFGAYLHVAGRRDAWQRLAPWLIVLGFIGVLFTYIGAGLFLVGEHGYGAP